MLDLTLPEARAQRDSLTTRVDVLDKVGTLATLPDDMHVTTDMVATYYEVPIDTVRSVVKLNREEIDDDGYRVVSRTDFERSFGDLSNLDPRARSIALFPRRAVLRVGMLLRDSQRAREVRDYLLDAERPADIGRSRAELLTRADLARMVLEAEEEKAVIAAALESAAPAIAYHDRYVANDDAATVKAWGAQFGISEPTAYALLVDRKVCYKTVIGERWSNRQKRKVTEYEYRAYAKHLDWFDLRPQHNAPRHHNGQVRQTLYVRQAFALHLASKCGLSSQLTIDGGAA
ncbi:phage antirepressor YoqD-like protein [Rhodococcus sp. SMB37]|uniref:phage antirepressor KilAC domain-containing protein n=1 Tax=Rhodococcus sp. SMB37 TaxID=2512213 RepID=UPI0010447E26|nr:phage antirepressor KilAC domain-containing protein [Rhodococcus sp. SMB37]TCN51820.1 phage antirepressor YoqD-like protein [Rhodococcus sp. SMB37]